MLKALCRTALGSIGFFCILLATPAEPGATWPREIKTDQGILTIYQPQPETFQANELKGRAAVSLLEKNATEPTFGVFWFTARVDTDRDAGTSLLRNIVVTGVRWPDSKACAALNSLDTPGAATGQAVGTRNSAADATSGETVSACNKAFATIGATFLTVQFGPRRSGPHAGGKSLGATSFKPVAPAFSKPEKEIND
jgi:hypothetical protein